MLFDLLDVFLVVLQIYVVFFPVVLLVFLVLFLFAQVGEQNVGKLHLIHDTVDFAVCLREL